MAAKAIQHDLELEYGVSLERQKDGRWKVRSGDGDFMGEFETLTEIKETLKDTSDSAFNQSADRGLGLKSYWKYFIMYTKEKAGELVLEKERGISTHGTRGTSTKNKTGRKASHLKRKSSGMGRAR